jgi:Predicted DNA modification methylase
LHKNNYTLIKSIETSKFGLRKGYYCNKYFFTVSKLKSKDTNNHILPEKYNDFAEDLNSLIKEKNSNYILERNKIITLEPNNFDIESTTIWSFPNRGNWATHNSKYRGNWSPYIPRNIILRYSNENDIILDQFLGSGTTMVEVKLLNRKGVGIDINSEAVNISKCNLNFYKVGSYEPEIIQGNAMDLNMIKSNSIDLICTHPPYANIIKYSKNLNGDLSLYEIDDYLRYMKKVASESFRVLKPNKYCSILIGDIRKNKHIVPLGFRVMQEFLNMGFILKEIVIKEQHNCKSTSFWEKKSIEHNFLLIAHEYLFIFRRP